MFCNSFFILGAGSIFRENLNFSNCHEDSERENEKSCLVKSEFSWFYGCSSMLNQCQMKNMPRLESVDKWRAAARKERKIQEWAREYKNIFWETEWKGNKNLIKTFFLHAILKFYLGCKTKNFFSRKVVCVLFFRKVDEVKLLPWISFVRGRSSDYTIFF
jgi:hypothetical protein